MMATSFLERFLIIVVALMGTTMVDAQHVTTGEADEYYSKFYTSNVRAVDSLRQWALINHWNPYGKNEMEAVDLKTGEKQLLPKATNYSFISTHKILLFCAGEAVLFKDLLTGKGKKIAGSFIATALPEIGKVVLYEQKQKAMLVCNTEGKVLVQRNNIDLVKVNKKHHVILALSSDEWLRLNLNSLITKKVETESVVDWCDVTGDTAWGMRLQNEGIVLTEWNMEENFLKKTDIKIPAGFKVSNKYTLYTELKNDKYIILPLEKNFETPKDLVNISYSNRNNGYKHPFRQLAIYDLQMKKWRHLPATEDIFFTQNFINEKGDFIHYDEVTSNRDTLNNYKTEITLITNFGEKRFALNNPYFNKANYNYDSTSKKMLYFEEGQWWIHDLSTNSLSEAALPKNMEWRSEIYSGLSDVPQAPAIPSGKEGEYIIQDSYDLYLLNLRNNSWKKLTDGRKKNIRYSVNHSGHSAAKMKFPVILEMFNMTNYHSGFAYLHSNGRVETVVYGDFVVKKAWTSGRSLIYTTQSYQQPLQIHRQARKTKKPIYKSAGIEGGKLPDLQKEIFQYTLQNGKKHNAVLLYPARYDDRKKYPLVVNVYEDRTREILNYRIPHLNDGMGFNFLHYVYQNYFVLLPDLDYESGKVGEAIVSSVVAVTDEVFTRPNIDRSNIAVIGGSFGGYESTLLIGKTNIFKTAVAGVAVVDLPRTALTYIKDLNKPEFWRVERQQNRMDKNLFGNWQLYLENSPIYHLPKVTKPVLLWTGTEDGNVNPDQSRAYFLGLQRQGKIGALLEYSGEGHNILGREKQHDLNVKIWEWLDYFLKGKQAAPWIAPLVKNAVP